MAETNIRWYNSESKQSPIDIFVHKRRDIVIKELEEFWAFITEGKKQEVNRSGYPEYNWETLIPKYFAYFLDLQSIDYGIHAEGSGYINLEVYVDFNLNTLVVNKIG